MLKQSASGVLASFRPSTYPEGTPCILELWYMRPMERDRSIRLRSEETVAEPGRHVLHHPSPNSCRGHRARIGTRTGFTKEEAMQTPLVFVGIDVSKVRLDVAVRPSGELSRVTSDANGITMVLAQLRQVRIVMEATGGLERPLRRALVDAALPVIVVNPRQVRDFAKATGQLAKTDTLAAPVLARFAEVIRPALRVIPDAPTQELAALLARRRQVLAMQQAEQNRLDRASDRVRKRIAAHVHWLSDERARLDEELDDMIQRSPGWRAREELVQSVPAVIRPFYQRLRAAGKAPKVALVAAMRKLLTLLNAMVHDGTPWRPVAAPDV